VTDPLLATAIYSFCALTRTEMHKYLRYSSQTEFLKDILRSYLAVCNNRRRKFGETLGYNIPEANDLIQR